MRGNPFISSRLAARTAFPAIWTRLSAIADALGQYGGEDRHTDKD